MRSEVPTRALRIDSITDRALGCPFDERPRVDVRLKAVSNLLLCLFATNSAVAGGIPASATTSDGVFTLEQAERGRRAYASNCSTNCHKRDLSGSMRAPALASDAFLRQWEGQSLDELFSRISTTMPQLAPGSLSQENYANILAFLLLSNGLPAGPSELKPDREALRRIEIRDSNVPQ